MTDVDGAAVPLTRAEFDVVAALYHSGAVPLRREYLLEVIAVANFKTRSRTVDVIICRIRRKLAAGAGSAAVTGVASDEGAGAGAGTGHAGGA